MGGGSLIEDIGLSCFLIKADQPAFIVTVKITAVPLHGLSGVVNKRGGFGENVVCVSGSCLPPGMGKRRRGVGFTGLIFCTR